MPRVELGAPPDLGPRATYPDYKPWLLAHFADHLCSYCFLLDRGVHVDHYEPQGYAEARIHDPTNLLLGCDLCNGTAAKWDYHPLHASRKKLKRDLSGHYVIDVRADDFAELFVIHRMELSGRGRAIHRR